MARAKIFVGRDPMASPQCVVYPTKLSRVGVRESQMQVQIASPDCGPSARKSRRLPRRSPSIHPGRFQASGALPIRLRKLRLYSIGSWNAKDRCFVFVPADRDSCVFVPDRVPRPSKPRLCGVGRGFFLIEAGIVARLERLLRLGNYAYKKGKVQTHDQRRQLSPACD
jgi:hypothetical protein